MRSTLPALAYPSLLSLILVVAGWLRWRRFDLRFNQITFAYAAYFQPYLEAWHAHDVRGLFTLFVGLHPPLYSALHALLYDLWGAPAGYLAFSGGLSLAAIWVTAGLAREAYGRLAGLVAAALGAVSIYQLHYALEVNNYPLLLLTSGLAQWAFLRLLLRPGHRRSAIWAAAACAALYTHGLAGLIVALQGVAYLAIHRTRRLQFLLWPAALVGIACLPLMRTVLELAGRGSTYHNEAPGWGDLWVVVVKGMALRFGPVAAVLALLVAAALGLLAGLSRPEQRRATAGLTAMLLAAPAILMLSRAGIAAAHQYPYYLLVMPAFLTLAARGLVGRDGEGAGVPRFSRPWELAGLAGAPGPLRLSVLAFVVIAQWMFGIRELAEAHTGAVRFETSPHAVKLAMNGARAGDVIWLVAPALFPDDDKRAADPIYRALPAWRRCQYHQPADLRFEYVDYSYGQPFDCGGLTLFTFTDIYGSSMTRLLQYYQAHGNRVWIVLYDTTASPDYAVRLEQVLKPFHAVPQVVRGLTSVSRLYTVGK